MWVSVYPLFNLKSSLTRAKCESPFKSLKNDEVYPLPVQDRKGESPLEPCRKNQR